MSALPIKYRLIAALVAALLLLTGCTLFHEEIHGLWLRFYDGFVQIGGEQDNKDAPKTIETFYAPTYLPEGFVEKERMQLKNIFSISWESNESNLFLWYTQETKSVANTAIDTEHSTMTTIQHNQLQILTVESFGCQYYIWEQHGYVFQISTNMQGSEALVLQIISSIKTP